MNSGPFERSNLRSISLLTVLFLLINFCLPLSVLALNQNEVQKGINTESAEENHEQTFTPTRAVLIEIKTLGEGVEYHFMRKVLSDGSPAKIHCVRVEPGHSWLEVRPVLAGGSFGKLDTLTNISNSSGALAAINGNFYYMGGQCSPSETTIIDKRLLIQSPREATALIFASDKQIYIDKFSPYTTVRLPEKKLIFQVDTYNRASENGVAVYDSWYGESTRTGENCMEIVVKKDAQGFLRVSEIVPGNAYIPLNGVVISLQGDLSEYVNSFSLGDVVVLNVDFKDKKDIVHLLANGPLLVTRGCKTVPVKKEGLDKGLWFRHPRTAIGVTAQGEVIMTVVDGRQEDSAGMTFSELADLMLELGAVEAMAMDGGGSSELVIKGEIANTPSDNRERKISTAIVVLDQIPIYIDGKRVFFGISEVPPCIENGRILVPVRKLFEVLGAELSWDAETKTITATRDNEVVKMQINSTDTLVKGKKVKIDVAPQIKDGRALVPLRFVSQVFGGKVEWDPVSGAYITTH